MKTHTKTTLFLMVVSFAAGMGFQSLRLTFREKQEWSLAMSELQHISRAASLEKLDKGEYPETLEGLKATSSSGDFSEEFLRKVTYFKIEQGFIVFVGLPKVVIADQTTYTRFK